MPFWDKFFGDSRKKDDDDNGFNPGELSPWERFAAYFTRNNGKFLLARSGEEVTELLRNILEHEQARGYWIYDEDLGQTYLAGLPYSTALKPQEDHIFFGNSRYLLENSGGILFTSYETGDYRLIDLPGTMVFLADPSQLVPSKEKAMENINRTFRHSYPSHIQSIVNFSDEGKDFSKNVYLILKT